MNQFLENLAEEAAYKSIQKHNPKLLKTISIFVINGFTPEQIVEICVQKTKQPRHRLDFIGCAAEFLVRENND
jgi:hypothetical protein